MKKLQTLTVLLLLVVAAAGQAAAQNLSTTNLAWKYRPDAPLQLSWELYQPQGQAPQLVVQLLQSQPLRTRSLSGRVHYRDSLHAATSLHSEALFEGIPKGESTTHVRHSIDTTRGAQWLVLELQHATDSLRSYWYPLHLRDLLHFGAAPFYLQQNELPSFAPFLSVKESITPRPAAPGLDSLYLFVYANDFGPAPSPMTVSPTAGSSKMDISQRMRVPAGQRIPLEREGFYFLQADTSTLQGKGLRVENRYFPRTRTIEAFAGPIRYLSTNEEWTELEREGFSKQAIDRYWLRMTQSEDRARRIIRSYYRRVTAANRLFTSFKEGWKTDQGMIYVLYGPPDVVQARFDGEVWIYRPKGDIPELNFTFVRTVNPFAPNYHQLVRNKDYARTHFQIVSRWRRGQNLP
jgi:GWxTD domain-containing protein